jgi:hypothetical protein
MRRALLLGTTSLLLAGGAGFLTSQAISQNNAAPARTETITVKNGATGPAGPTGPAGTGNFSCPKGYSGGYLVINHPGGQTQTFTCLKDSP